MGFSDLTRKVDVVVLRYDWKMKVLVTFQTNPEEATFGYYKNIIVENKLLC